MAPLLATVALGLVPALAIAQEPESGVGAPAAGATAPEEGAEDAREPLIPALTNAKSPFRANRLASKPLALTPDQVSDPFEYPREPIVLSWAGVPGAVDYEVEIAANPGFSKIMWRGTTDQPNVVPEVLLPDGQYWWRVTPIDKAETRGLPSDAATLVKTWPSGVSGLQTRAEPTGGPVSLVRGNPYFSWNHVAGAREYEAQVAPADQFATPGIEFGPWGANFATPASALLLPDDAYQWRVRAKDPAGHRGPWVTSAPFTKAWERAEPTGPADSTSVDEIYLTWNDVQGADAYQVQITQREHNFNGDDLKVSTTTSSTGFAPTADDLVAKGLTPGDFWWRVRPMVDGTFGGWSIVRKATWTLPTGGGAAPALSSSGDSTTAYMPHLAWSPVAGASIYRVDIAADQNFNNTLESVYTRSHHWVPRRPLPDNQVSSGYWFRVVPGSGTTPLAPGLFADEDAVPRTSVRKQVRMVTGQSQEGLVQEPPILGWLPVQGAAKYELEISADGKFEASEAKRTTIYGTGATADSLDKEYRLVDGTWHWRVRAVDGTGAGQTWSEPKSFTLTRPRPEAAAPRNGETVVGSPRLEWTPIPQAAAYQVQLRPDRNFEQAVSADAKKPGEADSGGGAPAPEQSTSADIQSTFQTSWTPTGRQVNKPGFWYWRVRADYGGNNYGQWTPLRSFRSIRPADFNLNTIPTKVRYGYRLTVAGKLELNGKPVKKTRLNVERRFLQDDAYRVYGTVRTDARGRFAFSLPMRASASWRLAWRDEATQAPAVRAKKRATTSKRPVWGKRPRISKAALAKRYGKGAKLVRTGNGKWTVKPGKQSASASAKRSAAVPTTGLVRSSHARPIASEDGIKGQAPFAVTVTPRVTLKLDKRRVVRRRYLKLTGSIFPRRQGLIQVLGSDGWETIKKIKPRKTRFGTRIRAKLAPGKYRIRLYVPQAKNKRLGAGKSRRSGLFVYDKFVVRKGGR